MYAIVEIGNRQYKVVPGEEFMAEKAVSARTQKVVLEKVLLVAQDKTVKIGNPYLKEAKVNCELKARLKGKKKIAFKFRRRKSSQSKVGSRQHLVLLKVKEIQLG